MFMYLYCFIWLVLSLKYTYNLAVSDTFTKITQILFIIMFGKWFYFLSFPCIISASFLWSVNIRAARFLLKYNPESSIQNFPVLLKGRAKSLMFYYSFSDFYSVLLSLSYSNNTFPNSHSASVTLKHTTCLAHACLCTSTRISKTTIT